MKLTLRSVTTILVGEVHQEKGCKKQDARMIMKKVDKYKCSGGCLRRLPTHPLPHLVSDLLFVQVTVLSVSRNKHRSD